MASVASRAHCRRNLRAKKEKGSRRGNCLKGWMLVAPRCSGGFSSGHFWIDGLRLRAATKAPQRGKGRAVPARCSSICSTEGGDTGVVHERELSIKQDKECAEPAVGSPACSATKRRSEWTCLQTQQSPTSGAAQSRECTASRVCGGSHAPNSSIAR
jgi:hypothetical protein